ncbi:MAG: glycosyltransferase [Actinobacteria bacterium]|nr:glycosyltransferase [Actinomycetota bacterium]
MDFFVHAPVPGIDDGTMGRPDYSYRVLLDYFLPVLERLGTVHVVAPEVNPDRDDWAPDHAGDSQSRVLVFAPPHAAAANWPYPAFLVLAFEFDRIPDESWDDNPRTDWTRVLTGYDGVIALSSNAFDAVRNAMGPSYPVHLVPTPVFDRIGPGDDLPRGITCRGDVLDSRRLVIHDDGLEIVEPHIQRTREWNGERVCVTLTRDAHSRALVVGGYPPEREGVWSRWPAMTIVLPFSVEGRVSLTISLAGLARNCGREIQVELGGATGSLIPSAGIEERTVVLRVPQPSSALTLSGIDASGDPEGRDPRSLGVLVKSVSVQRRARLPHRRRREVAETDLPELGSRDFSVELEGVVFTTVLNPVDTRKNWQDIVTAFVDALRDDAEATLVLKMVHGDRDSFAPDLLQLLYALGPMKCRVLAVRGYLTDDELRNLISATSYYVNASSGEGQCLPILEFMAAGVPAIAPHNTAMADYLNPANSLEVRSSAQPAPWPQDPRLMRRTISHRIDWGSLRSAFVLARDVISADPHRYEAMSLRATADCRTYCADEVVGDSLAQVLDRS